MVRFGQVVIGAPGAGKSTYCRAAGNYLNAINRECVLINLGKFFSRKYTKKIKIKDNFYKSFVQKNYSAHAKEETENIEKKYFS